MRTLLTSSVALASLSGLIDGTGSNNGVLGFSSPSIPGGLSRGKRSAFVTPSSASLRKTTPWSLHSNENDFVRDSVDESSPLQKLTTAMGKTASATFVAAALWASPLVSFGPSNDGNFIHMNPAVTASAKEMASGSGSRVNKDPESLLRYGLPIKNKDVRKMQVDIENVYYDTSSKRLKPALDGVRKVKTALNKANADKKFIPSCRDAKACNDIIDSMNASLEPLEAALSDASGYFSGSEQERDAIDRAYKAQYALQHKLTDLEEQMIPADYVIQVPADYDDLPQLKGRATVEFVIKKPDGSAFDIEGSLAKEAKMVMIIDGYSAPVTGGNFVELVKNGFYKNMAIQRSDGFVVQTGDPDGEAEGYVATPSKSVGAGPHGERLIPLEIAMKGDAGPLYESSMEDEGRGGQATVLPFSSYGAMGWAREEYEANSGSSQFFWLLFDSDLTPAGKNVLDGRYPCFGYVVEGADFLRDVKEGDIITSAKVTSGLDKLVLPKA